MVDAKSLEFVSACRHNPLRVFAAHEVAAFCDPSMSIKMTVQFNLFGGGWGQGCKDPGLARRLLSQVVHGWSMR